MNREISIRNQKEHYKQMSKEMIDWLEHEESMQSKNKSHNMMALDTLDWAISKEKTNPGFVEEERDRHSEAAHYFCSFGDTDMRDDYEDRLALEMMQDTVLSTWLSFCGEMNEDVATQKAHELFHDSYYRRR